MTGKKKTTARQGTGAVEYARKQANKFAAMLPVVDGKRLAMRNVPYVIVFYLVEKLAWLYRYCVGDSLVEKLWALSLNVSLAFENPLPSPHPRDLLMGLAGAALVKGAVCLKERNAKKFRQGEEYGSARWGT